MRKIKIRSKRQLDAHNAADAAVLANRANRARAAVGRSGVRVPSPEEIERFAVGGCNGACSPPVAPASCNDCYHEVAQRYRCPITVVSGGLPAVVGQEQFSFGVEPSLSNYFLPLRVRLSARTREDLTQTMLWRLTAVLVKKFPQESYHEPNPDADTVVGVESVAYDGVTSGKMPGFEVAWGPFARSALADNLELFGWSPHDVGTTISPRAEIWGYCIDTLPDGWKCGQHPGMKEPPRNPPPPPPPNNNGNPMTPPSSSVPVG